MKKMIFVLMLVSIFSFNTHAEDKKFNSLKNYHEYLYSIIAQNEQLTYGCPPTHKIDNEHLVIESIYCSYDEDSNPLPMFSLKSFFDEKGEAAHLVKYLTPEF